MNTITLQAVKAEQQRLADMIATLEANAQVRTVAIPAAEIALRAGEHYAGLILGEDGQPGHHLILMADAAEGVTWKQAKDWAAEIGGELPTRREQALLFANLKDQFEQAWYWSSQQHESNEAYAWCQGFGIGLQHGTNHYHELRARAVRRLAI